ncbi:bifunctional lysylphosphatidylglycerol flippase/synthetase MprF [Agromyces sp. M3QZ16-3]|uniref:bifunctional lysylphosphatidylglycerol flippase/synthetase MprF n=1 Tax=Agromyces sp. M3QZ16-3 TaxID=3447585 RepID=UPI003F691D18
MATTQATDAETSRRFAAIVTKAPATIATVAVILIAGLATGALWSPFVDHPLFESVAYGLPAFAEGKFWTPITGTFFVDHPVVYLFAIASFAGMAFLEIKRGTRTALGYFWVGQLFAILASALFLWLAALLPWPWAQLEATVLDVGPSGGTVACIAAAVGLFVQPWRVRAWLVLIAFSVVTLLFWGSLADLEHAFAVGLVLVVDRSLKVQRTTVHEQRIIAGIASLALGAIVLLTTLAPTFGPFGRTEPAGGSLVDLALDVAVILIVTNGLVRGRRWAWVLTVIWGLLNFLVSVALVVLLLTVLRDAEADAVIGGDAGVAIATGILWLMMAVYLITVRRAFAAGRRSELGIAPAPTRDDVARELRAHGGGTLSWMTTWPHMQYARTSSGIVAYQRRAGVALVLADPLGPAASRDESVLEFIDMAEHAGLVPCFFSSGEATRAAVPDGWRSLVVADDTIVDLEGLAFSGKRWAAVRGALNRAEREGMEFRLTRLADESWGIRAQLRAISEQWVGDKDLPEMGFTLGTLDEAADPEVRLALAISPKGDVDGFLSWLPVYGDAGIRGWTLELMRRREHGFGPVMEFLIGSSAQRFAEEGAEIMSLSGAPLTHDYPPDAGRIAELSELLSRVLEPVYGFQSLHRFKGKFNPRFEQLYLLYRDEADLTRIGAALTRAFLPDASVRQFAGAGLELVRRPGGAD